MPFKIKNTKLALLALIFFCLFSSLGFWQLSRASQKRVLLDAFAARTLADPYKAKSLQKISKAELRFYRAELHGRFDNAHTFLLDNKTLEGHIGYEIYTPFLADGLNTPILVDRGFIPIKGGRSTLPNIKSIDKKTTITGLLNLPPKYVALGKINASASIEWPMLVEYINTVELAAFTREALFPMVLILEENHPAAYTVKWQIVMMSPEKHNAYAIQWFALALTLLVLFLALNRGE